MEIQDFFDTNSVSLEVSELYEDYCGEKGKKTALNTVRKELSEQYSEESDLYIVLNMTLYWNGLKSGFIDEKSRKYLKELKPEEIQAAFDERDAELISEVIEKLLESEPIKPVRKKIDYSNPRSKNWKKGDIYAYKITGQEAESLGIAGKYALIYCYNIEKQSVRTNYVDAYILLYLGETLTEDLNLLLQNSVFLPVDKELLYRYHFFETHDKYPTDKLVYMGNKVDIEFPIDEHIPKNSLYYLYTHWENFVHTVCFRFGVWKKYGEGHEKFKI